MQAESLNADRAPDAARSVEIVTALIERARAAQGRYAEYDQAAVDEVVTAVGWSLLDPANNRRLAEQAVADTGLGRVEDKVTKNHRKTLGLLRDLARARSVGVVAEYPERGLVEIARPVGVVGAVVPSTNPVATPYNNVLNALKGANAVILAPSPKGQAVGGEVVALIQDALRRVGAPPELVQTLPAPVSKAVTTELMRQVDLVVVTGSQNNVRAAYTSGTPAIGVGAGNVPSIVDASADLDDAAAKITASKTFDNATSCSSENSLIVLDAVYEPTLQALRGLGARRLDPDEKARLQALMWVDGRLNPKIIAQSAAKILEMASIDTKSGTTMILVEDDRPGPDRPFSDEKLSPVLTVYRARDFEHACRLAEGVLEVKGKGHSVSIHTRDDAQVLRLGLDLPVCRVIVNQAHAVATGGAFDNGMPFSLSMGCGTWGGNGISDNLNYRHFLNTTRLVRTIPEDRPSLAEVFGEYWRRQGIDPPPGEE